MDQSERVGTGTATTDGGSLVRGPLLPEADLRSLLDPGSDLDPDRIVELVCADQVRRWRAGQRVPAEAYLELHPVLELGGDAALEVVFGEFALREQAGESPTVEEYQRRFPEFGDRLGQIFAVHRLTESILGRAEPDSRSSEPGPEAAPGDQQTVPDSRGQETQPGGTPGQGTEPGSGAAAEAVASRGTRPGVPAVPGYRIERELGRGGMGVVYLAHELRLNRPCALKMILAGAHSDTVATARFLAEAQAVAQLQHPNIVQIHHIDAVDGLPYFELEYLEGGSLDQRLDGTPWAPRRAAGLVETLARAVAEAHRVGVVHRDLKPGNILLAADGSPKITDFGLAKSLSSQSGLTATDSILGSPSYMAPEQAQGQARHVGPAADVYALGAILYELLTGRPPFRGATLLETIEQVKMTEPVPPSRVVPKLPRDIETITLECLDKEPSGRYPSAQALADDLRRFLDGSPIVARPVPLWERGFKWASRRPVIAGLVGAVLLLLGGLLVLWAGYSIQLKRSLEDATRARDRAESATRAASLRQAEAERARGEAQDEADRATLSEVRALRLARPSGWRDDSLKKLGDVAVRNSPHRDLIELRTEAVACLGKLDVREVARFTRSPEGRLLEMTKVAFSPDGTTLAMIAGTGSLDLWDVARFEHLRTVIDPAADLEYEAEAMIPQPAIAFRPNGHEVVYGTWDRRVAALDPQGSGLTTPRTILQGRFPVRSLAFDHRGSRMAVGWADSTVGVYDTALGAVLRTVQTVPIWWTVPIAISPDGSLLATRGANGYLEVHETTGTKPPRKLGPVSYGTLSLAFSPDGGVLAVACNDSVVRLYDVALGDNKPDVLHGHTGRVLDVAFSPDGGLIGTAGDDETVRLWDARTTRAVMVLEPRLGQQFSVAFSPDGDVLATSSDRALSFWRITGRRDRVGLSERFYGTTPGLAFHPTRPVIAAGSGEVVLWDLDHGGLGRSWSVWGVMANQIQRFECLAFQPGGGLIAFGPGQRGSPQAELCIPLFDPETARLRGKLAGHGVAVRVVAFDPSGRRLASGADDGSLALWDMARGGTPVWRDQLGDRPVRSLAFREGGATLLAGEEGETLALYDANRGMRLRAVKVAGGLRRFAAAQEDGPILAATAAGEVRALAYPGLTEVRASGKVHADPIQALALSPDGHLLASGDSSGHVVLSDAATLGVLLKFPLDLTQILALAFDPRGQYLAISGVPADVSLWDLDPVRSRLGSLGLGWTSSGSGGSPPAPAEPVTESDRVVTALTPPAAEVRRWPALLRQAIREARMGRHAEAEAAFAAAVALVPDDAWAWMVRGRSFLELGRFDRALDDSNRAVALAPDDPRAHELLGEVQARQARWAEAAAAFTKAVALATTPFRPTISHHAIRTDTGMALGWFQTDGRQPIWCRHAVSLLMLGDRAGYRRACAALIGPFRKTSDPIRAQAMARCSTLAPESVAESDSVVGLAELGVLGSPDDQKPRARTTLAAALLRAGRLDAAIRALADGLAQDQSDGRETRRRWAWLALAHARRGDPMTARRWLDQPHASTPSGDLESFWDEVEIGLLRREAEALLLDAAFPPDPFVG